ncbi:SND2/TMEM208 family protein [Aspergillus undulatus]|uniref:SND2/TMEM208 family protein n=1 Tax=Aspergillus undulatus TaxID=1810928 RepID=UPI003CCDAF05
MAQKASKTLAARNTSILLRTHLITLLLHALHLTLHFVFNRPQSLNPYYFLVLPTLAIEFYLDKIGRPTYATDGSGSGSSALRSPGEDLNAAGLTEYMWDVLYWTWGCIGAVCVFGDRAWWLWVVVPVYSVYLAYSTVMGVKGGLKGFGGGAGEGGEGVATGAESKRQRKMEKRGGQRMQYR